MALGSSSRALLGGNSSSCARPFGAPPPVSTSQRLRRPAAQQPVQSVEFQHTDATSCSWLVRSASSAGCSTSRPESTAQHRAARTVRCRAIGNGASPPRSSHTDAPDTFKPTGKAGGSALKPKSSPVPPPAQSEDEQPSEAGILPDELLQSLKSHRKQEPRSGLDGGPNGNGGMSATSASTASGGSGSSSNGASSRADYGFAYPPAQRNQIRESWDTLMRWSKVFRTRKESANRSPLEACTKVAVFGGGSFGTAMGAQLARQKKDLEVVLLLRDPHLCRDINTLHCNTKYLKDFKLPPNMRATTLPAEAIIGAQYAVHAVPVQSSRAFLQGIKDILPPNVPIICVSKGLEVGSGQTMSDLIPSALERKQPAVFISGPSFAKEVMNNRPTGVVAACKDPAVAKQVQGLFASPSMRVNTSNDVVGVEICGALKNVLAIAAGIVEGLDLGHNAVAALITQGCSEIRWLAEKLGASPTTVSGLSGLGDIMLTCYGDLSRNRSVGIRLGRGEKIEDIVASSSQVAEGVATAGVVVMLARKYRVSLPVLTAVAQVLDGNITPREAVYEIMNLPQIEEV